MLLGILVLLGCLLAGELIVHLAGIPVPGSVVGMLILLAGLRFRGGHVPDELRKPAETLLRWLPMLLVPAGVGLMVHYQLMIDHWWIILGALMVSTVLAFAATVLVIKWLRKGSGA